MPEICDLEVFRENLHKIYHNQKLTRLELGHGNKVKHSEKELNEHLAGKKLHKIDRRAKELYFNFGDHALISMHLMLHGKLSMPDTLPDTFIVALIFDASKPLVLTDYQRAAKISLNPEPNKVVDALDKEMTPEWLQKQLAKRKAAIKTVLIDPKFIGGIGNAYADEILYDARIHPESVSNQIPTKAVHQLASSITEVIHDAIKKIKQADPDIISGEIRDFLAVHNHKRKTSPGGKPIKTVETGGRKTYYSEEQVEY